MYFLDVSEGGTDTLKCTHCGEEGMDPDFMEWLTEVRMELGIPMKITAGYRCREHPLEIGKSKTGSHSTGKAVDVALADEAAIYLIEVASRHGCSRIGVNANVFIHLDLSDLPHHTPQLWTY